MTVAPSADLRLLQDLIGRLRLLHERTDTNAKMRAALATGLNVQTLGHYLAGRRAIGPIASAAILRALEEHR